MCRLQHPGVWFRSEHVLRNRRTHPYGNNEEDDGSKYIDRPLAIDLSKWIESKHADSQSKDKPRRGLRQDFDSDSKFLGDRDEARTKHGTVGSNDSSRQPNDEKNKILPPRWPYTLISGHLPM